MAESEQELLRRYAWQGDAEAFRALVNQHQSMVYAVCCRVLRNSADAEDATQECFLTLARKAAQLHAPIAGWLHHVAVQVSLDQCRSNYSRHAREQYAARTESSTPDSGWDDVKDAVDAAISELPERLRIPLVLHHLEGRTQEHIAREMGLSQSAVSRRLSRGVELLRRRLAKAGVVVSCGMLALWLSSRTAQAAPPAVSAALGKIGLVGVGSRAGVVPQTAAISGQLQTAHAGILAALVAVTCISTPLIVHYGRSVSEVIPRPIPVSATGAGSANEGIAVLISTHAPALGDGPQSCLGPVRKPPITNLRAPWDANVALSRALNPGRLEPVVVGAPLASAPPEDSNASGRDDTEYTGDLPVRGEIGGTFLSELATSEDPGVAATAPPIPRPAPLLRSLPARTPSGFIAAVGTIPEPYTNTGWAAEIIHQQTGMCMVFIPAGQYTMGSRDAGPFRELNDGPMRSVLVALPFYMGKYEVTQAQWEGGMGYNPSVFRAPQSPVDSVSWDECQKFIGRLRMDVTGLTFRLPTEAEWEYACRAGTTTPYCFGTSITTNLANFNGLESRARSPRGIFRGQTVGAGSFPSNAWRLCDMHGNVWEWCQDIFLDTDTPASGARGASRVTPGRTVTERSGVASIHAMRGGGWDSPPEECRSASRQGRDASWRSSSVGVRVIFCLP
jgi:RNA polymerase sigma factor (sigma-70 family)